jgi:hypothetical protein
MSDSDYTCTNGVEDCACAPSNLRGPKQILEDHEAVKFVRIEPIGESTGENFHTYLWSLNGDEWWLCPGCHRELTLRDLGRQPHVIEEAFS